MNIDEIRSRLKKSENHRELSVALLLCAAAKLYEFGIDPSKFKKELRKLLKEQKICEESTAKLCGLVLDGVGTDKAPQSQEEKKEDQNIRFEEGFDDCPARWIEQATQNPASEVARWLTSE
ncbi:hypothetical protein [Thermotoga caldifontis]|uniref:hypothetical protein n=1 Tax=Thermotoga caldifontis TaxID=1508419 RepID=UPI000597A506|nr:hypothetical protein [Thermotoga caldifontis]